MKVEPYVAYKGFTRVNNELLRCRDSYFNMNQIYETEWVDKQPRLCSSDGYHYCDKIIDLFTWYPYCKENAFCEIEVLGEVDAPVMSYQNKRITTSFRIIRELTEEEINKAIEEAKERKLEQIMQLEMLLDIQKNHPQVIISGSVALFLHGVRLKRFESGISDVDIIVPYYTGFISHPSGTYTDEIVNKRSGNDFDYNVTYRGISLDVIIDPKQRYQIVKYKGNLYKVSPIENILAAKIRYSQQTGGEKHKNDIHEMLNLKKV